MNRTNRNPLVLVFAMHFAGFSLAHATQTVTITDPTKTPKETWTVGNTSQSVTFTFTEGYSSAKIKMYEPDDPSVEYSTLNLDANGGASTTSTQVSVPVTAQSIGTTVPVTIKAAVYDIMSVETSDTTEIDVYRPIN